MRPENNTNTDFCVCCGEPVPEGRLVCFSCETNPKPIVLPTQTKREKKFKKIFDFLKGAQK